MKSKILLSASVLLTALAGNAQDAIRTFAFTGDGNNDFMWMNIRQVDLNSGLISKSLFERSKTNYTITNVETKAVANQTAIAEGNIYVPSTYPTATFVAAAAFDKRSDKLFFIPMRMNELRWVDVSARGTEPKFYSISSNILPASQHNDEGLNITRMTIGADRNGYAITNDGNHLIRFTTGKKPVITDLGSLIDAEENKGISVHNKCTSWGGDMVADAFGKLYIISANRHVFTVDIESRIATHTGTISGLPNGYTTNGAAVDDNGDIVVTSANVFAGYYRVKLDGLTATQIEGSDIKYNAADLANGNLLLQKQADAARKFGSASDVRNETLAGTKVVPNPVTGSSFKLLLNGELEGAYNIIITDVAGRNIQSARANLVKGQVQQNVNITRRPVAGTYFVKVVDAAGKTVLTDKVIIQ